MRQKTVPAHRLLSQAWGKAVRARRQRLQLTQVALATQAGLSQSTISEIETGSYDAVDAEMMLKLAVALDCEPADLFAWPHGIGMIAASQAGAA